MAVLLPVLSLLGLVLFFWFSRRGLGSGSDASGALSVRNDCRFAFLEAWAVWGVVLLGITEGLSLFHCVGFGGVAGAWGVVALGAAGLAWSSWRKQRGGDAASTRRQKREEERGGGGASTKRRKSGERGGDGASAKERKRGQERGEDGASTMPDGVLLAGVALIVLVVGATALIAPPNTWDAMTYHMARVVHWIQNKSVAYYPTHIERQLHSPPWAEYVLLHLQILSGGDRLANMVQWFSMVGSILGASLLARQLGAGARGQVLTAVLCATLPMGILQGSSTQNDYVVTLWLVCLANALVPLARDGARGNRRLLLLAGCSAGLAILTKATAYLFIPPLVCWFAVARVRVCRSLVDVARSVIAPLCVMVVVAVALNAGFYARNLDLYGSLLGPGNVAPDGKGRYTNNVISPGTVLSNVLRNAGLHLGARIQIVDRPVEAAIRGVHRVLGIDMEDPRTTWVGTEFHLGSPAIYEDSAGNTWHFYLLLGALAALAFGRRLRRGMGATGYVLGVIGGALVFCAYLRWQPWHSRLHLPLFVLAMPVVGAVLASIRWRWVALVVALFLFAQALSPLLRNERHPLMGEVNIFNMNRASLYFLADQNDGLAYAAAGQKIVDLSCTELGLVTGADSLEYPLWALLNHGRETPIRIEHVMVENRSAAKALAAPFLDFSPPVLLAILPSGQRPPEKVGAYAREGSYGGLHVYVRP